MRTDGLRWGGVGFWCVGFCGVGYCFFFVFFFVGVLFVRVGGRVGGVSPPPPPHPLFLFFFGGVVVVGAGDPESGKRLIFRRGPKVWLGGVGGGALFSRFDAVQVFSKGKNQTKRVQEFMIVFLGRRSMSTRRFKNRLGRKEGGFAFGPATRFEYLNLFFVLASYKVFPSAAAGLHRKKRITGGDPT